MPHPAPLNPPKPVMHLAAFHSRRSPAIVWVSCFCLRGAPQRFVKEHPAGKNIGLWQLVAQQTALERGKTRSLKYFL